ncbi:MAG: hypothetical protein QOE58_315 [Actinomycetota bacterium]|jgi:hypothetical protein|nr:hypothetical protein [Actinomycetota bacterium]
MPANVRQLLLTTIQMTRDHLVAVETDQDDRHLGDPSVLMVTRCAIAPDSMSARAAALSMG